jgi:hypothetical protein
LESRVGKNSSVPDFEDGKIAIQLFGWNDEGFDSLCGWRDEKEWNYGLFALG